MIINIQWLEDGVLGYLREWKNSVDQRPGTPKFTEAQKKLMMLSDATREGVHITGIIIKCTGNYIMSLTSC